MVLAKIGAVALFVGACVTLGAVFVLLVLE
jgi:hypothetical protein